MNIENKIQKIDDLIESEQRTFVKAYLMAIKGKLEKEKKRIEFETKQKQQEQELERKNRFFRL